MTLIDLWILANALGLPIVLLSGTTFKETKTPVLVLYKDINKNYVFLVKISAKSVNIPQYNVILNEEKEVKHTTNKLSIDIRDFIKTNDTQLTLEEYIKSL